MDLERDSIKAVDFCLSAGLFEVRAQEYLETLPSGEQSGVNRFLKGLGKEPAKPLASQGLGFLLPSGWAAQNLPKGDRASDYVRHPVPGHVSVCWHAVGSASSQSLSGGWWRTKDWAMSCICVF